jgi:hypothetical protein
VGAGNSTFVLLWCVRVIFPSTYMFLVHFRTCEPRFSSFQQHCLHLFHARPPLFPVQDLTLAIRNKTCGCHSMEVQTWNHWCVQV